MELEINTTMTMMMMQQVAIVQTSEYATVNKKRLVKLIDAFDII